MMNRVLGRTLVVVLMLLAAATTISAQERVKIAFIERAGDPFYAPRESYGGIYDATRQPAVQGAELAVKDAKVIGRAVKVGFELVRATIEESANAPDFVQKLIERDKPAAVILDLPEADMIAVARSLGHGTAIFNIRHRSLATRQQSCATSLFHVIPSTAMVSDALAQYLKLVGWGNLLVLASESPSDLAESASFESSARKFGLTISEVRTYVHGNDPRQRDQNSVRLLTGGDYDAVFVADETREFARLLPYRTMSPRPVVGAAGLSAFSWHSQWERNGAPQLNRRFFKFAKRTMTEEDWAAWVAVRAVVEATVRSKGMPLPEALLQPELTLELYKGFPGSFRPWDRQLRQSILLATTDTVIALAPVEGALHQFNTLDTLGIDEPEFSCAE